MRYVVWSRGPPPRGPCLESVRSSLLILSLSTAAPIAGQACSGASGSVGGNSRFDLAGDLV